MVRGVRLRASSTAIAAFVLSTPSVVSAQGYESEVRIDQLVPATAGSPFIRAEGPTEPFDTGIGFGVRLDGDYQYRPLASRDLSRPDETIYPVEHALLLHAGGSITPLDWMTFELSFAAAVFEEGTTDDRVLGQSVDAGTAGQGDIRIGAHFRPIESKELDLSLGARFWAPTGSHEAYLAGDNSFFRLEVVPAVAGDLDVMLYGCTLGLAPMFFAGRDGDRLAASCAAHFKIVPAIALGIEPHVAVYAFARRDEDSQHTPGLGNVPIAAVFEPLAVFRASIGDFSVALSGGPGIGNAPGAPVGRLALTLGYASRGERIVEERVRDRDLDGIPDDYDACPDAAGSEARRGCPEPRDLDGDGLIDDDACPDQPGPRHPDPEASGCPDRDNDSVPDPIDPCPDEPGTAGEGCPRHARLRDGDFVVDPPIAFDRGAKLTGEGEAALVEILATMRVNPKIQQISISIGTRRAQKRLTDERAAAILELLGDQNVDSSRYEVVLADNLDSGVVEVHVVR
jgi:hypothetical protein